jgi:hypothetical protein
VLANDGASIFQPLAGDAHSLELASREINVQQRAFRQALLQDLAHGCDGKARGFREIEFLTRDQAESYPGDAQDGSFERARDRP